MQIVVVCLRLFRFCLKQYMSSQRLPAICYQSNKSMTKTNKIFPLFVLFFLLLYCAQAIHRRSLSLLNFHLRIVVRIFRLSINRWNVVVHGQEDWEEKKNRIEKTRWCALWWNRQHFKFIWMLCTFFPAFPSHS